MASSFVCLGVRRIGPSQGQQQARTNAIRQPSHIPPMLETCDSVLLLGVAADDSRDEKGCGCPIVSRGRPHNDRVSSRIAEFGVPEKKRLLNHVGDGVYVYSHRRT